MNMTKPMNTITKEKLKNSEIKSASIFQSLFFSKSLLINENIEKIWEKLYEFKTMQKATPKINNNDIFFYSCHYWKIGSQAEFNWFNFSHNKIICIEKKYTKIKRQITWHISTKLGLSFNKTIILFNVSNNNSTLLKLIIDNISFNNNTISFSDIYKKIKKDCEKFETYFVLNLKSFLLKETKIFINQESCVLNGNNEEIFKKLLNINKVSKEIPLIGNNFVIKGDLTKKGSFIKYCLANENKFKYLLVKDIKNEKNNNIKMIQLEYIGSSKYRGNEDYVEIILTKISNERTQFSVVHNFNSFIKINNVQKIFILNKRELVKRVKTYINDFNDY